MENSTNGTMINESEIEKKLKEMADGFGHPFRGPILKTPADYNLEFEDVTFPSQDGVPLEAWYIPCSGSDKLIIINYPLWFNRYGLPAHIEPWKSLGAKGGNTFEVDYVPDIQILHEAGYNVLTYDERNFGLSGEANGGLNSGGRYQGRDVIGSLMYARIRRDTKSMSIGLYSRCNGANATLFAMYSQPDYFKDIRCMVACQPLSVGATLQRDLEREGLSDRLNQLEWECRKIVSFTFAQMTPVTWASAVHIPTLLYQVHDDLMTYPGDVQAMFDAMPVQDKKLIWIHGTSARWDGYLYFQREPQQFLDWFDSHM